MIGILTYSYFRNYGARLQAYSLKNAVEKHTNKDVEFIIPVNINLNHKLFQAPPGDYYMIPVNTDRKNCTDWGCHSPIDNATIRRISDCINDRYDTIIVGSDEIWREPDTIFFLNNNIKCKKIALAPSSFQSINKSFTIKLAEIFKGYDLITYRDNFTKDFLNKHGCNNCNFLPDPAFLFQDDSIDLNVPGINNSDKKIVLTSAYNNKSSTIQYIIEYYKSLGYLALDINELDIKDYSDWYKAHGQADVCITDKFHGSISCFKNKTKVLGVNIRPAKFSKIQDLFDRFNMGQYVISSMPNNLDELVNSQDMSSIESTINKFKENWSDTLTSLSL